MEPAESDAALAMAEGRRGPADVGRRRQPAESPLPPATLPERRGDVRENRVAFDDEAAAEGAGYRRREGLLVRDGPAGSKRDAVVCGGTPFAYNVDMRIILTGDQFCDGPNDLVAAILARPGHPLWPRHRARPHGDDTGIDEAVKLAAKGLHLKAEEHPVDSGHPEGYRFRNREMLLAGAGAVVILHRTLLDGGSKDLARQAIVAGVPTYLIDSEDGRPRRMKDGDGRLA